MRPKASALGQAALTVVLCTALVNAFGQGDAKRGEYLAKAAGCAGCHTEDKKDTVPFAGGRALKTPFGTFFGPNITPHPQAGIGSWTEADFFRAMREGDRPDGKNYFPAFPYPSFTKIVDRDLRDLWAFLRTLPPSARANQEHDLRFPFGWRFLVTFWKWFFFTPGPFTALPGLSDIANRGAYLVQALGHCSECHTPRNFFGGPKKNRFLAGGKGPDGKDVANLTPARLKKWSDKDLQDLLTTGLDPEGDVVAETMGEVIQNTTSQLASSDLDALIAYLRTLPPIPSEKK
ncbi:MAG: c-type cytochrome [Betaproteobacteria bacterium]|nr:MAG: c-type cytochrome [Betaproteobacteria bacterium]